MTDNVTIGPNSVLESCILCAGVQVSEGSQIVRGSLVADGVKLGPGTVLIPLERVSARRKPKPAPATGEEDECNEGNDEQQQARIIYSHQKCV